MRELGAAHSDNGDLDALDATRRANLRRLFNPKSIAVVGASTDPSKAGSQALRVLADFPGRLVAVHPREKQIQGFPAYPSIADLPEAVDLAILAIPPEPCVKAAAEAAARGVGGMFIISGGFSEAGPKGAKLQDELGAICRDTGLRLVGPNTSGFLNPVAGCVASFVPGVDTLRKGNIAVVAQSGGVNLSIGFLLAQLGEGISLAVGLGNAVDVRTSDLLDLLADDPDTTAIALHLEGVVDGRALYETLRRVTPRKPVVAVVAGRADIGEFAISHTGNLMGSRERTVAALTQAGAVVVDSLEDLALAVSVLGRRRLPPKPANGVALITGQAGPALLVADALKSADISMPSFSSATMKRIEALLPPMTFVKNPVDTGRPGPGFPDIVRATAEDDAVDLVLVFGISEPAVLDPVAALRPAAEATGKPIVFGTLGTSEDIVGARTDLNAVGIPTVFGPDRLALAGVVLDADSRRQALLAGQRTFKKSAVGQRLSGAFDESRAKELVRSYGIDVPESVLCETRDEALAAFARLRKPVVVKIAASDIAHKTEAGGVILNVRNEEDLKEALERIGRISTATPGRVLIEEMAPSGVELIVGGVRDPSWGPCVVIGIGGVLAEAMADTSVRLAPLTEADVADMLNGLRGKKLLDGFRDLPRCDRGAIAAAAVAVGTLLIEHPEVAEVEINPLRVNESGAIALDALVVLGEGRP